MYYVAYIILGGARMSILKMSTPKMSILKMSTPKMSILKMSTILKLIFQNIWSAKGINIFINYFQ